jgi:hypothetical protein
MEVLLHPAGKRRSMARRAFIAGRRSAAVRGSMARPQPIAERRSALARPRSTAARHFTAAVRMAAEHHISRWAARMAAVGWGVAHMVAAPRISLWGLRTAAARHTAVARMAAGEAATTAEMPASTARWL